MGNVKKGTKGFVPVPLSERFWRYVRKGGKDECWPWTGSLASHGGSATRGSTSTRLSDESAVRFERASRLLDSDYPGHLVPVKQRK